MTAPSERELPRFVGYMRRLPEQGSFSTAETSRKNRSVAEAIFGSPEPANELVLIEPRGVLSMSNLLEVWFYPARQIT